MHRIYLIVSSLSGSVGCFDYYLLFLLFFIINIYCREDIVSLRQLCKQALRERNQEQMLRQQEERRARHLQSDCEALGKPLTLNSKPYPLLALHGLREPGLEAVPSTARSKLAPSPDPEE